MHGGLLDLIKNENMKIYRRRRTWILMTLLLLFIIGGAFISKTEQTADHTWMFISISSVGLYSVVALFGVIIASDIVASEFTWGTIKMLLVRPQKRGIILLSKFIAVLLFTLLLLTELLVGSWVIGGFFFGFDGMSSTMTIEQADTVINESASIYALKLYGLHLISLTVTLSIAFMLSTVFRSGSLAIGISIFVVFSGDILTVFLGQYEWGKFVLFPNLALEQYVTPTGPLIEGMSLPFSLSMNSLYFLIFIAVTWIVFRQRDIAA